MIKTEGVFKILIKNKTLYVMIRGDNLISKYFTC